MIGGVRLNICFLLGGFTGVGGIGRVTSIIANELAEDSEYNISAISFYKKNKPNLYELNNGISHDYLFQKEITMKNALMRNAIGKLRNYLMTNKIDILVCAGAIFYPLGVSGTLGLKTKCICWEHSNVQNDKDHSFQFLSRWIGAKKADYIVTLTKHDKESYSTKYNISNVDFIYNPIDKGIFEFVKDYNWESKKIISVGRLSYQKNFENLIEVAKLVLPENPEWSWDIYGEGDQRDHLSNLIEQYDLSKQINLKGRVDNLYEIYNEYAFLVMTSRYEGFPMTLLEGMAHGLPLVSYDILTGPNEIIEHGLNGFLVEPFNSNEMAELIKQVMSTDEIRIDMSIKNRSLCKKYTLNEIIQAWKDIFNQLSEEQEIK